MRPAHGKCIGWWPCVSWMGLALVALAASLIPADASAAAPTPLQCGDGRKPSAVHRFGDHHFPPEHGSAGSSFRHYGQHHPRPHPPDRDFVRREGTRLVLHGRDFRFGGTNNYYLDYKSELVVDDVLEDADDAGFAVVRAWAFLDIGNADGSNSVGGGKGDGVVYNQFFDGNRPAYNDGPDGLQHLDYAIYRAGQLGIKLVLPLTNNWTDFGGMDQYVRWAGGRFHDQFYTDATIRTWYESWISHVLNHKNAYSGVALKDDPTIMTWELANEPRCRGSGAYPTSSSCKPATITAWADEMSRFIKSVDHAHLVSVGDDGFYCDPSSSDSAYNCGENVDTLALTALPAIDVMSFHLYPDAHGADAGAWGQQWIERHFADAFALGKAAMLGEYGVFDTKLRAPAYKLWADTIVRAGGNGALFWMLAGIQDNGSLYPDYPYTVFCPSPECTLLAHSASVLSANRPLYFPPVADDDTAVTKKDTPITLAPLVNDVAYLGKSLVPGSLDLDPATPGQQLALSTRAGTFSAQSDGSIAFTPASGFSGEAVASYTVSDTHGKVSEPAALSVTVKPAPGEPRVLYSFETGTDGWFPATFSLDAGTLSQSADFATDGSFSLKVTPQAGGWFGVQYGIPLNLAGMGHMTWDVKTTGAGASLELAMQLGNDYAFCSGGTFPFVNANSTATIDVDLGKLDCGVTDLSIVQSIYIFVGGGGTDPVYIDNVRALPTVPATPPLYSFESGVEGWAPGSFNANAGVVEQSADFSTDGNFSLKVTPTPGGGWFGVEYASPISFAGKTRASFDIETTGSGSSFELALQVGDAYTFCSGGVFRFVNANSTATIQVDLTHLDCGVTDLGIVHNLYVFMGNAGPDPVYIDNVRFD